MKEVYGAKDSREEFAERNSSGKGKLRREYVI